MNNQYVPFWNTNSELISKSIWNPEDYKENLVKNESLYINEISHPEISANKILDQSRLSGEGQTSEIIMARKIRFFPTKTQKGFLNKYLSAHRYFYNKTIEEINRKFDKKKEEFSSRPTCIFCSNEKEEERYTCSHHRNQRIPWEIPINFNKLRDIIVINNDELEKEENKHIAWQMEIPHDTRQAAVRDAVSAYSSAMTNKRRGNIKSFHLGYMSIKKPSHIFWIDHRAININRKKEKTTVSIFKMKMGKDSSLFIKERYKKQLPLQNKSAVKILYDRGAWYLVFTIKEQSRNECKNLHSISLDPGVRTFQTGYSPNGSVYKFGEKQLNQMKEIHSYIDKLKSIASKSNHRKRQHIKKRLIKLEFQLRGLIHNLHNQVGSFLSKNYRYILLPEFGTSGMQQQKTIGSTTKRRMNGLAHYQFQLKMIHLCKKYGSELKIVDESFTSKTCGSCGKIKEDLGSACHYSCSDCSYQLDRDIHGARNIFIKNYSS